MPSSPLPPFDKSAYSKIVGMYVLVPKERYPGHAAEGVIGWAARIVKFSNGKNGSKVILKIEDDKPATFTFGGGGKHDLWNLRRLT